MLIGGGWTVWQSWRCSGWPTTEGVVTAAEMQSHSDNDGGTTYSAEITYRYEVAGIKRESDRLAFGAMSASAAYARGILAKYPAGQHVVVHYRPDNPDVAVLETGIHGGTWILFGVGTLFVLVAVMFLQVFKKANATSTTIQQDTFASRLGDSISTNKPPVLFGIIFLLVGLGISLIPPEPGKPAWLMYVVGGFFASGGVMALAMRSENKRYRNLATIPFLVLFLILFNWVGFVLVPKSMFTGLILLFDVLIPVMMFYNIMKGPRP